MAPDDLIARPGDPDLDCHLTVLRLTSVVESPMGDYHAEAVLGFDDGMTLAFRYDMPPGGESDAAEQMTMLRQWRDTGAELELTAAPGKWTLLQSGPDRVVVPRREPVP